MTASKKEGDTPAEKQWQGALDEHAASLKDVQAAETVEDYIEASRHLESVKEALTDIEAAVNQGRAAQKRRELDL